MNVDEAYDVINRLAIEWPYVRDWPDEKTAQWVHDVQELDYERARRAVNVCREQHAHAPAWAQFREAYRTVSWQALAPERQPVQRRPELEAGYLPKAESIRRLRMVRQILAKDENAGLQHNHHRGALHCPICGKHDHDTDGKHTKDCRRCKATGKAWYQILTETDQ